MAAKEILTLQFGHYSNYVGTHWWNLQELSFDYKSQASSEINHDVLYREGKTSTGATTYTPRLLLVDLKGSLGALPKAGTLYDTPPIATDIQAAWDKPPVVKAETKLAKNTFQQELDGNTQVENSQKLEDEISVWSDYLYGRFHPRTVNVINDYEHQSNSSPFNLYPLGRSLWNSLHFQDEFCDSIRKYVEECDYFQGFQIILDSTDGMAGLSGSCMEYLKDEYGRSIFALPLISASPHYNYNPEEDGRHLLYDANRTLNVAFCYSSLAENASVFVPLCTDLYGWKKDKSPRKFNHLIYNEASWYQTSAILASALDTFTLKYRVSKNVYSLPDFAADLTPHGKKAASASLSLPFSINNNEELINCLDNWDGPLSQSITPNCDIGNSYVMQLIGFRGLNESRLKKPADKAGAQKDMPAYKCNTIKDMFEMYYSYSTHACVSNVTNIEKPLSVQKPYPSMFDDRIGYNGNVIGTSRPSEIGVDSVPVLAGLHSSNEIRKMFDTLYEDVKKIKYPRFTHFISAGLDKEEYEESVNNLLSLGECYEDNYLL